MIGASTGAVRLAGVEADPALALEVLLRRERERRRRPAVALEELVEPVHPVRDPAAAALEHDDLQLREAFEHAAVDEVRRASSAGRTAGSARGACPAPSGRPRRATRPACRPGPRDGTRSAVRSRTAPPTPACTNGGAAAGRCTRSGARSRPAGRAPRCGAPLGAPRPDPASGARRRRRGGRVAARTSRRSSRCRPGTTRPRGRGRGSRRASGRDPDTSPTMSMPSASSTFTRSWRIEAGGVEVFVVPALPNSSNDLARVAETDETAVGRHAVLDPAFVVPGRFVPAEADAVLAEARAGGCAPRGRPARRRARRRRPRAGRRRCPCRTPVRCPGCRRDSTVPVDRHESKHEPVIGCQTGSRDQPARGEHQARVSSRLGGLRCVVHDPPASRAAGHRAHRSRRTCVMSRGNDGRRPCGGVLAAIHSKHVTAGVPSPAIHTEVRVVAAGAEWRGRRLRRPTQPLHAPELFRCSAALPDTIAGRRDRRRAPRRLRRRAAAHGVGRARRFRPLDRTRTARSGFESRVWTVRVPPGSSDTICAVPAWSDWKRAAATHLRSGPAFRPIDRHGNISRMRLSDRAVTTIVQRAAARAGLPPPRTLHRPFTAPRDDPRRRRGRHPGRRDHGPHRPPLEAPRTRLPPRPLTPPPGFCDRTRAYCAPCVAETGVATPLRPRGDRS